MGVGVAHSELKKEGPERDRRNRGKVAGPIRCIGCGRGKEINHRTIQERDKVGLTGEAGGQGGRVNEPQKVKDGVGTQPDTTEGEEEAEVAVRIVDPPDG